MNEFIPYNAPKRRPFGRRVLRLGVLLAMLLFTAHWSYKTGVRHGVDATLQYLFQPAPPRKAPSKGFTFSPALVESPVTL